MTAPDWVADAIFYQIFPDRFARSSRVSRPKNLEAWDSPPTTRGKKGGDLFGVFEHLDYLAELGVNALYLNPIFESPANHRYHTSDYFEVDPLLGGNAAFRELVEACHARNFRVVIDGVFNHSGRGFAPFVDVLENGAASPYVDWFHIEHFPLEAYGSGPSGYAGWAGLRALPKLNTDNREVREYLMRVGEHWARAGIDGWRLDTPEQIETPGFWEEFRERTKAINPDLYLVGEVWKDASEWIADGRRFDGALGYWFGGRTLAFVAADRLDLESVRNIDYPYKLPLDGRGYAEFLDSLLARYSPELASAGMNLDSSHDTPRLLHMVGGDVESAKLARLLAFTFVGAPCIFYGDEIGLSGPHDPGCRIAFPWDRPETWNRDLLETHRALARLRREHVALRRGTFRVFFADADLIAFVRETNEERLLVAVNGGTNAKSIPIEFPNVRTLFGEGRVGAGTLESPPRSGAVFEIRG